MKSSSGQTLVEMVVAVGMVSLVLVAVVSGIALSVRNSRFSKNKSLATRYSQEGIEVFRSYRDEFGWGPFFEEMQNSGGSYCFPDLPTGLENLSGYRGNCVDEKIEGTDEYTREIEISVTTIPSDWVDVKVEVSWIEGLASHSVELSARYNDWSRK